MKSDTQAAGPFRVYSPYKSHISEQTEKTRTKWVGGGPEEATPMLFAIVNFRMQPVEFTASVNGILLTLIAAVIPTETERDYITKGDELLQ